MLSLPTQKARGQKGTDSTASSGDEAGGSGRKGKGRSAADLQYRKSTAVMPSLDLHGMETMEALPELDKYIDDAFLAGLREVQINHGRGTGVLRSFVHDYLRHHRLVKSFRDGDYHEGGIGVTIVQLDL